MNLMAPLAVGCVLAFLWGPAFAADELGLSKDRVHWSADLTTPLFEPNVLWVPGDSQTASFWVRNQSTSKASLNVAVLGSGIDSLMQTGDLSVSVKADDGSGSSAAMVGSQTLLASHPVSPGQEERIDVTVSFDRAATNQSQVKQLDLQFEVRLTQMTATRPPSDSDSSGSSDSESSDSDSDGHLPGTGSSMDRAWLLLAGALIGTGVGLSRRPGRGEPTDV